MSGRASFVLKVVIAALSGALASGFAITATMLVLGGLSSPGIGLVFAFVTFIIAVPVCLAHGLLLAVPAYLLLHRRAALSRRNVAVAGFAIAAVPIALVYYLPIGQAYGSEEISLAQAVGQRLGLGLILGVFGAVGGLVFRRVLRALDAEAAA